jgi:hypothetical protein
MRLLHRSGIILAFGAGLAALQLEPAVIGGIVFDHGAGRLSVGSARVPLWSAAWAQTPDTLALENVKFTFGSTSYEAKRIEFSGLTSTRADIDALLASGSEPFATRLTRINARQITIPELKLTQKLGPETSSGVYKNIVLTDIVQGRVGQTMAETAAIDVTEGKDRTSLTYGRMSIADLDLKTLATVYETKAETVSDALTKVHGAFSIDDLGLVDGKGLKLKAARLSGRDFMARPTKDSWSGTAAFLAEIGQKKELSDEDHARMMPVAADMLSAFDIGFVEMTGLEMKVPPEAMKAKKARQGKVTELTLKLGRIAYTSATAAQPSDIRMEGFEIFDEGGRMSAASTSLTGFSFQTTLNAMRGVEIKTFEELDAETLRAFVPTLGTLRISGLDLDVPKEDEGDKSKGKKPERIKAHAEDFELTADKPFNGVPTNVRIRLQGFSVPLPENSKDDGFKDLLALGYKSFTLGTNLEANWNEATNEVAFSYAFDSQNMARTSISGLLGNVTKEVFNPDTDAAMIASMDARTKSMKVEIQNHGLVDVYLAQMAKEQKTTPEALRKSFSTMAGSVIPTILGESEQGKAVGQAVARFIEKPGRLTIDARSKDPAGLGILQLMAIANNPTALDSLNITAMAE